MDASARATRVGRSLQPEDAQSEDEDRPCQRYNEYEIRPNQRGTGEASSRGWTRQSLLPAK